MTRRTVLKAAIIAGLQYAIPIPALPCSRSLTGKLRMYNVKTDETLAITYLSDNRLDLDALEQIEYLFRYDTGAIHKIDPRLIVLLDVVHTHLGARDRPILLLSGYRPPSRRRFSYHHKGMAADLRIDGIPVRKLRDAAVAVRSGGVGYYSSWVHIDVGPYRTWTKRR